MDPVSYLASLDSILGGSIMEKEKEVKTPDAENKLYRFGETFGDKFTQKGLGKHGWRCRRCNCIGLGMVPVMYQDGPKRC